MSTKSIESVGQGLRNNHSVRCTNSFKKITSTLQYFVFNSKDHHQFKTNDRAQMNHAITKNP